ncbi:MAG: sugar phosphate isomerase/epimerase [Thermoguttaceae bacterium]|nr:sugar phosphate isomerase/epimerase [Thermoguttaceae bacterium]
MKNIYMAVAAFLVVGACAFGQDDARLKIGTNDVFKGPVGLQLWSLRDIYSQDREKGLQTTEDLGFGYIEFSGVCGPADEAMARDLKKHHLVPISGHWDYGLFKDNPAQVVKEAKALGVTYAGVAWLPHDGELDEAEVLEAAKVFNEAGKYLAERGINFFYHNHGYEFVPYKDGKTMFDLLVEKTDPKYVSFQMDVMWTVFPGQDAAALLRKYPDRWSLFHLKDLKKGVKGDNSGGTSTENDVILGSGQVPYAEVLKAAQEVGVKYYFIEDESPRAVEQIPQSLKFLGSSKW